MLRSKPAGFCPIRALSRDNCWNFLHEILHAKVLIPI